MTRRGVLTAVWFTWGAGLFLLMIALTAQPALFGSDAQKAWNWFLPNIAPVLTMVGAGAYAAQPTASPATHAGAFALALGASIFYLTVLTGSIAATLFTPAPLTSLNNSGLWLGPLQGFATSGLALFFVKR